VRLASDSRSSQNYLWQTTFEHAPLAFREDIWHSILPKLDSGFIEFVTHQYASRCCEKLLKCGSTRMVMYFVHRLMMLDDRQLRAIMRDRCGRASFFESRWVRAHAMNLDI
jgi:hypothetical protein